MTDLPTCLGRAEEAVTTCRQCDTPVNHKHGDLCASCIADSMDYDETDCWNCGGDGFTYGCGWDWQCDTWDGDSCLCTRRCEWCVPLTAKEQAERTQLGEAVASALRARKAGEA